MKKIMGLFLMIVLTLSTVVIGVCVCRKLIMMTTMITVGRKKILKGLRQLKGGLIFRVQVKV